MLRYSIRPFRKVILQTMELSPTLGALEDPETILRRPSLTKGVDLSPSGATGVRNYGLGLFTNCVPERWPLTGDTGSESEPEYFFPLEFFYHAKSSGFAQSS
jgi:hypothetical protein